MATKITNDNITSVDAAKLSGTIADARFPATLPAISGANLTNMAGGITMGTAQTSLGAAATFSGFPSGTKRITISIHATSDNQSAYLRMRLGDAGGIELGGNYVGQVADVQTGNGNSHYNDFELTASTDAGDVAYGIVTLTLLDASTNLWAMSSILGLDPGNDVCVGGGTKSLSGELTQFTIDQNGDLDAGSINVLYE